MIDRRQLMTSAMSLIAAPALPAVAKMPAMGSKRDHTQKDFRTAFDAYIDAYRAFFAFPPSSGPEDEGVATDDSDATGEARVFWQGMLDRCRAWRRRRKRLVKLVLEANGYEIEGPAPPTVSAAMVDLGDVLVVVSGESMCEGAPGRSWMNCINFCVVPRSLAMKAKLEALPTWSSDECCDDSCYSPRWYRGFIESHSTHRRDIVDDDMED
jgi:hypothetical protein